MATKLAVIVADFTTTLATKIAVGGTTATLQSATDDDGVALPSGEYAFTLNGDNAQKEHIICTLSGTSLSAIKSVTRQGVQSSGTVREHRVGSSVKITNFTHIKYINDLLDGTTNLDADTPLEYDGTATIGSANQIATKAYVDGVAIAGGADASTTVKGISKMSVAPVSATEPIAVGDNDNRVPTVDTSSVTSGMVDALAGSAGTPSSSNTFVTEDDTAESGASKVVKSKSDSLIDDSLVALTTAGDVVFSDGTDLQRLGIGTANQVLTTNSGATAPEWADSAGSALIYASTTNATNSQTTSDVTLFSFTLPGGSLSTGNVLSIKVYAETGQATNSNTLTLKLKYGSTTVASGSAANRNGSKGYIELLLMGAGTTSTQEGSVSFLMDGSINNIERIAGQGTATEDSTGDLTVDITASFATTNASNNIAAFHCVAELIK